MRKNRTLLILGCSATKDPVEGLLPALRRYRGAYYQIVNQVRADELPEILILSAEFGFISSTWPIPDYDRRMDRARAEELLQDGRTRRQFCDVVVGPYDEVFIAAGADYRRVILPVLAAAIRELPDVRVGSLLVASGGIGYQRQQLKKWLSRRGAK